MRRKAKKKVHFVTTNIIIQDRLDKGRKPKLTLAQARIPAKLKKDLVLNLRQKRTTLGEFIEGAAIAFLSS